MGPLQSGRANTAPGEPRVTVQVIDDQRPSGSATSRAPNQQTTPGQQTGAKTPTSRRPGRHTATASALALNALTGPAGPGKDLPLPPAGPTGRPAVTEPVTREALDRWQATTRPVRTDRPRWTIAPFEPAAPWRPATGTTPSTLLRAEDTTGPAAG